MIQKYAIKIDGRTVATMKANCAGTAIRNWLDLVGYDSVEHALEACFATEISAKLIGSYGEAVYDDVSGECD